VPLYGAEMGNILGDAVSWVKSNPLAVIAPPLWVAKKTLTAVPPALSFARNEVRSTLSAFRPSAPANALTSALTLGSGATGGEPDLTSSLPIILGAAAAAGLLLLAFSRRKKHA
jgi:LPXTG-motif cell wall-anchored protein